jgi:snurportin-1
MDNFPFFFFFFKRRALKIEAARQIDQFGQLSLGPSEDTDTDTPPPPPLSSHSLGGVAPFVPFLEEPTPPSAPPPNNNNNNNNNNDTTVAAPPESQGKKKRKRKRKVRGTEGGGPPSSAPKPSKWADKCMYAELLEISPGGDTWACGLPEDLETGWVAVGPVPAGKRCLAVTHQAPGIAGVGTLPVLFFIFIYLI